MKPYQYLEEDKFYKVKWTNDCGDKEDWCRYVFVQQVCEDGIHGLWDNSIEELTSLPGFVEREPAFTEQAVPISDLLFIESVEEIPHEKVKEIMTVNNL